MKQINKSKNWWIKKFQESITAARLLSWSQSMCFWFFSSIQVSAIPIFSSTLPLFVMEKIIAEPKSEGLWA